MQLKNKRKQSSLGKLLSKMVEGHWLETAVDYYLEHNQDLVEKPKDYFRPSGAAASERELYLARVGFTRAQKRPAQLMRIFNNGDAVHNRLYDYFDRMGILIRKEFPIEIRNEDFWMKGRADVELRAIDGNPEIYDVKSANERNYEIFASGKLDFSHIVQWHMYAVATENHRGGLIIENKNTQALKVISIDYDQALVDTIFDKFRKVEQYVQARTFPPACTNCRGQRCDVFHICSQWDEKFQNGGE
jgi:CRISPR/Cas system-associated exonuclease Cas4 (RecB family)